MQTPFNFDLLLQYLLHTFCTFLSGIPCPLQGVEVHDQVTWFGSKLRDVWIIQICSNLLKTSPVETTGDLFKTSDLKPINFEHQSKVSEYREHLIMIDHDTG